MADKFSIKTLITNVNKMNINTMPMALFMTISAIVFISAYSSYLPKNMIGGLAVIMTMGFVLSHIGRHIPVLKDIGGPAILCLMVPSVLVYFGIFQTNTLDTVHLLMKEANLLYFVIASLVVGSILGMNRVVLIQGMTRMFIPLVVGTITAVATGLLVGKLFGFSLYHTFSLLLYRLSVVALVKVSCRCPWLIRRFLGKHLMFMLPSWLQRQWSETFLLLFVPVCWHVSVCGAKI